ncbi:MAG: hypothetical protein ACYDC1_10595 [Limisphaerales bacterium]
MAGSTPQPDPEIAPAGTGATLRLAIGLCAASLLAAWLLPLEWRWPRHALLGFILLATLTALRGRLPWQNVLAAAATVTAALFILVVCARRLGGSDNSLETAAQSLAGSWWLPPFEAGLLAVGAVLAGRESARRCLAGFSIPAHRGLGIFSLGTGLAATPLLVGSHAAPTLASLLALTAISALLVLVATPWLISKHPMPPPSSPAALVPWCCLALFPAPGFAIDGRWPAAITTLAVVTLVIGLAWRRPTATVWSRTESSSA